MIRLAAVAAALIVAAWFGLGVRQASSTARARERVSRLDRPSPAAARRTATLLGHAATLNPDTEVDVLRARLELQLGRIGRARRLLLGVVRREPANLEAWAAIVLVFDRTDPALARRARAQLRRLSPPS